MKRLSRIFLIINRKTLIITALAVISTYFCARLGVVAEFPLTLIATAVVFPIVFSISGAYKRREAALDEYGCIKAHGRAIFFATRDWLDDPADETLAHCRELLRELLDACRSLFAEPVANMPENEKRVYLALSDLSAFIRTDLRQAGLASGEVSRCNQYLSKMLLAFENVKHIYQYRTPRTLRTFSDFFITILPPLYGPYFAYIAQDYSSGLMYVMPILFSFILVSLDNIQAHLENPFDQIGEDDVMINVEKFVLRLDSRPAAT